MTASTSLLEVDDLHVSFARREVVHGVSFSLAAGEVLGLIGESGSGKTVTGMSLLRLLPGNARVSAARLSFDGTDLPTLPDAAFEKLRGRQLATIFQDPAGAFNPCKSIGWHIRHALRIAALPDDPGALLAQVGIDDPGRVLRSTPHQLSGGMLQRALIAMVVALRPRLIVADEPTTNLDNIIEKQILRLIAEHCHAIAPPVLFITHDLTIAGEICDRIAVMYAGEIMEIGPAADLLRHPLHPYTDGLRRTARSLDALDERLFEIPGEPAGDPRAVPDACRFAGRCPAVMPRCRTEHPAAYAQNDGHLVRCFLHGG